MTSERRASCAAASQSVVWPLPLTGPSNSTRAGSAQAGCGPGRITGSTLSVCGRSSASMSSMSVCRMSGLKSRRMSTIGSRVGWRVTATQATLAARRRRELAGALRRHLAHRGREHETDGIDFAGERRAHRLRRGHAADLDERPGARHARPALRARAAPRRALARAWRAPARRIRRGHQRAADQRQVVTAAATRAASAAVATPLSATRVHGGRQLRRERVESARHHLQRDQIARIHADQQQVAMRAARIDQRMRQLDVRRVEGFEQHEHAAARARCR